jgi:hypothetical protein
MPCQVSAKPGHRRGGLAKRRLESGHTTGPPTRAQVRLLATPRLGNIATGRYPNYNRWAAEGGRFHDAAGFPLMLDILLDGLAARMP